MASFYYYLHIKEMNRLWGGGGGHGDGTPVCADPPKSPGRKVQRGRWGREKQPLDSILLCIYLLRN